jgi:hypothetical protein
MPSTDLATTIARISTRWKLTCPGLRDISSQATMSKKQKDDLAMPIKDEEQEHPIPLAWRSTFREIVNALAEGDYRLARGVAGVDGSLDCRRRP